MTDLNLALTIRLMDRATAPLRAVGRAMQGFGRQARDVGGTLGRLTAQQGAIDTFKKLKERLDQSSAAMRTAKERAEGLGRELAQARRRGQDLGLQLDLARREVDRLGAQMGETKTPSDALKRAFAAAEAQAGELEAELKRTGQTIERLDGQFDKAREGTRQAADAHRTLGERTERARRGLRDLGLSSDHLADAQRQVRSQTLQATEALARQADQAAALKRRTEALAQAREKLGKTMMLGAGIGASGYAVQRAGRVGLGQAQTWMDFDAMLDTAMSKMPGATDEDRQALKALAMDLGDRTAFSATQVMEAIAGEAAKGRSRDQIVASLPDMVFTSAATDVGIQAGSDLVGGIVNGMGMVAGDAKRVGDVITATVGSSAAAAGDLGEAFKVAAPAAAGIMPVEMLAAIFGVLADNQIKGSEAGTAMRGALLRLAAPTGAAAKVLRGLGVEFQDAEKNMLPFETILQQLKAKLDGMGSAERIGVLKGLVGEEAITGVQVLLANLDTLGERVQTNALSQGRSQATAKQMTDNLKGDVTEMFSALEGLVLREGGAMNDTLREMAQSVTGVVRAIAAWTDEHPMLTATLGKVAAFTAAGAVAVGGLMTAVGAVIVPTALMRFSASVLGIKLLSLGTVMRGVARAGPLVAGAFRAMGVAMMTTPIGWVVGLAVLLAAAAYAIYANWDQIGAWFQGKWDQVKSAFEGGILNGIMALLAEFHPLSLMANGVNEMIRWLTGVDLREVGKQWMSSLRDGFAEALQGLRAWLQEKVQAIVGVLPEWLQKKLGFAVDPGMPGEDQSPDQDAGAPAPGDNRPAFSRTAVAAGLGAAMAGAVPAGASNGAPEPADWAVMADWAATGRAMEQAAPAPATVPLIPAVPVGGPAPARGGTQTGAPPETAASVIHNQDNSTSTSVTVNVPPGSDINAIVQAVTRELERRQRGALHDLQ